MASSVWAAISGNVHRRHRTGSSQYAMGRFPRVNGGRNRRQSNEGDGRNRQPRINATAIKIKRAAGIAHCGSPGSKIDCLKNPPQPRYAKLRTQRVGRKPKCAVPMQEQTFRCSAATSTGAGCPVHFRVRQVDRVCGARGRFAFPPPTHALRVKLLDCLWR
jgi:hypothetical protein